MGEALSPYSNDSCPEEWCATSWVPASSMGYHREDAGHKGNFKVTKNNPLITRKTDHSCSPIRDLENDEKEDLSYYSQNKITKISIATSTETPHEQGPPITISFSKRSCLSYEEQLLLNNQDELAEPDSDVEFADPPQIIDDYTDRGEDDEASYYEGSENTSIPDELFLTEEDPPESGIWKKIVISISSQDLSSVRNADDIDWEEKYDERSVTVVEIPQDEAIEVDAPQDALETFGAEVIFPDEAEWADSDMAGEAFNMQRRYRPVMKLPMPALVVSGGKTSKVEPFPFYSSSKANGIGNLSVQRTELPKLPKQRSLNLDLPLEKFQLSPRDVQSSTLPKSSSTSPRPPWSIKRGSIPPLVKMNATTPSALDRPFPHTPLQPELSESAWASFQNQSNGQQLSPNAPETSFLMIKRKTRTKENVSDQTDYVTERSWMLTRNNPQLNTISESQLFATTDVASYEKDKSLDEAIIAGQSLGSEKRTPRARNHHVGEKLQRLSLSPIRPNPPSPIHSSNKELAANVARIKAESLQGDDWWKQDSSIFDANVSQFTYQDFGIQDYLSNENGMTDIDENLSVAGDFDKGLEVTPPSDLVEQVVLMQEEKLSLPSPERTASPLLLMENGNLRVEELEASKKKVQQADMNKEQLQRKYMTPPYADFDESINLDTKFEYDDGDDDDDNTLVLLEKEVKKFTNAHKQLIKMSSIDFGQLNQEDLDTALNITEDRSYGKGLSSSDDDLEDDIRSVQRLP